MGRVLQSAQVAFDAGRMMASAMEYGKQKKGKSDLK